MSAPFHQVATLTDGELPSYGNSGSNCLDATSMMKFVHTFLNFVREAQRVTLNSIIYSRKNNNYTIIIFIHFRVIIKN